MAEDIIITPGLGKIDFYDLSSNLTTWVIESGTLKFKRSTTTYLSLDNTYPNFKVTNANLYLVTSLVNNFGILINTSGWQGNRQPTGPTGAQGAVGAQGGVGAQGAQGAVQDQGEEPRRCPVHLCQDDPGRQGG